MTELRNVEADLSRFRARVLVMSIAVLVGSVRSDRQGIKAARFVDRRG